MDDLRSRSALCSLCHASGHHKRMSQSREAFDVGTEYLGPQDGMGVTETLVLGTCKRCGSTVSCKVSIWEQRSIANG